jgi:hypothetical protein
MFTSVRPVKRHHFVLLKASFECEPVHTLPLRITSNVQNCLLEANMNNAPQPIPPADADMALLFLGSWFEKLLHAPERHQATLDAKNREVS